MRNQHYALLFASLAFLLMAATTIVVGAISPGYSHVSQFYSELGATGAPYAVLAHGGYSAAGVALLIAMFFLARVLPRSVRAYAACAMIAATGVVYIVTAIFPCDPGCPAQGSVAQQIHNGVGVLGYFITAGGAWLLAVALRDAAAWQALSWPAALVGIGIIAAFTGMAAPALAPWRGLFQIVAEGLCFAWPLLLAWRAYQHLQTSVR